jgi:hypothetical protein
MRFRSDTCYLARLFQNSKFEAQDPCSEIIRPFATPLQSGYTIIDVELKYFSEYDPDEVKQVD